MMGGEITVDERAGQGLDLHRPPAGPRRQAAPKRPSRTRRPGRGPARPAAAAGTVTVLVIDDDPAVRDLMARSLAREGVRAVTAADGEEGLRLAARTAPGRDLPRRA